MQQRVVGCPESAEFTIGAKVFRAAVDSYGRFAVYQGKVECIRFSAGGVTYTVVYDRAGFKEYEVDPAYLFSDKEKAKKFVRYCRRSYQHAIEHATQEEETLEKKSASEARDPASGEVAGAGTSETSATAHDSGGKEP